jgi:phospholipid transport system substrate-binding protein
MKKILLSFLFLTFAFQASAEEISKSDQVKTFVESVGNKIIKIAGEKGLSEAQKRDQIISVVDDSIDSQWIARFVLGNNYRNASDAQKNKFMELYRQFMINTYGPKFKNYNGRKFTVISVSEQKSFFIAKAEFLPKDSNVAINTDFRVKEKDGKLMILDFIAEGISLIETQRSEFNSAISQKGMDQFLEDLALRVDNLKKQK